MPTPRATTTHPLRRVVASLTPSDTSDSELLGRFIETRDPDAFAALVTRHGPLVWGVCRRVVGHHHNAEDAFQATFLVLSRKAAIVRPRELLPNWLYGVALQTARKARAVADRQRAREKQVSDMPESRAGAPSVSCPDLQRVIDEELSRMPEKYRAVLVLCDLDGRTRSEAAHRLDVPEGTVAGWLARARSLLAKRLTRRGITSTCGALAAVADLAGPVPPVAAALAARVTGMGKIGLPGHISTPVAALTQGVLKAMLVARLKTPLVALVLVTLFCLGGVWVRRGADARGDERPPRISEPTEGKMKGKRPLQPAKVPIVPRAVYLVGKGGGALDPIDLKKHPEVEVVHTFAEFQKRAGKRTALWIDAGAIPLGDKEHEWIVRSRTEYTFVVVGFNEPLYCFRDQINCFGISGPGEIDWTKYALTPGFSVIRQRREQVGQETHISAFMRGYNEKPTAQAILGVTDGLLDGKDDPDAP